MKRFGTCRALTLALAALATVATSSATAQAPVRQPALRQPVPSWLQKLQLSQPFTLTYKAEVKWQYHGTYTRERVRVTLSHDGKNLLYRLEYPARPVTLTMLYDGQDTYSMESDSRIAAIDPGFDFMRLLYCPLPGVALPRVPLLTVGFSPAFLPEFIKANARHVQSEPKYVDPALYSTPGQSRTYGLAPSLSAEEPESMPPASVVTAMSSGVPKVLWYDTLDNFGPAVGTLWEFKSHERFEGIWIATKIRMRMFETPSEGAANRVVRDATYELQSAIAGPLKPAAYIPATYLLKHANVTDRTGKTLRTFIYEPERGPIEFQRRNGTAVPSLQPKAPG